MSRVTSFGARETVPQPLLVRPFQAGMIGWIVVFGAILAELVGGAVTYQKFVAAAPPVLIVPVAVAFGVGIVQWWQVRETGADPASWWHLGAIAGAVLIWIIWPTAPGTLDGFTGSAPEACTALPTDHEAECVRLAARALDAYHLSWWCTLGLIGVAALLARRSRIAAWAALPAALAGCQLASHFLEQLVLHFQPIS